MEERKKRIVTCSVPRSESSRFEEGLVVDRDFKLYEVDHDPVLGTRVSLCNTNSYIIVLEKLKEFEAKTAEAPKKAVKKFLAGYTKHECFLAGLRTAIEMIEEESKCS